MNIESISFRDLFPLSVILEKHSKSPPKLKDYFVAGIRKKILFYAVNQSDKYVHMIRWGEIEIDSPPYRTRIHEKEGNFVVGKGEMLPLANINQFDMLFKGVLNEIDLFEDVRDYDELIEYQRDARLFHEYEGNSGLTSPIEFREIEYKHIFIKAKNLEAIEELLIEQSSPKANIQARREIVFSEWLNDKDKIVVRNIPKKDVWEELKKLDSSLFNVSFENFFKNQDILKFNPGRKSDK